MESSTLRNLFIGIVVLVALLVLYSFGQESTVSEDWAAFETFLEAPFEWQGWHFSLLLFLAWINWIK